MKTIRQAVTAKNVYLPFHSWPEPLTTFDQLRSKIIGVWAPSDLWRYDLLDRKNYAMSECARVEIGIGKRVQNASKTKSLHKDSYIESLHSQ